MNRGKNHVKSYSKEKPFDDFTVKSNGHTLHYFPVVSSNGRGYSLFVCIRVVHCPDTGEYTHYLVPMDEAFEAAMDNDILFDVFHI